MFLKTLLFAAFTVSVIMITAFYQQHYKDEFTISYVDCPEDFVDNAGNCHFRERNIEYFTDINMCQHCQVDIVLVGSRWVHVTYPKTFGGYISCLDNKYKHAMVEVTTIAEPAK